MLEVNCFTFNYKAIVPKSSVSIYRFEDQLLKITVDDQIVIPFLKLIPTSTDFSEYDSLSLIHGNIIELFNVAKCDIDETNQELTINAVFTIEFSLGTSVQLRNNELIYTQDGGDYPEDTGDYSYKIEGTFTNANSPSLTESVDINSVISLESEFSINNMTRAIF